MPDDRNGEKLNADYLDKTDRYLRNMTITRGLQIKIMILMFMHNLAACISKLCQTDEAENLHLTNPHRIARWPTYTEIETNYN
jgi:hypothetical protein